MSYYRFMATLAYDGANYYGFERQNELPTIELALNNAFYNWLKENVKIVGSGRTDRFVHALGQVIHFDLTKDINPLAIKKALNSFLLNDIKVLDVKKVDMSFHARFSAIKKEYHYVINTKDLDVFNERYTTYCYNLDLETIKKAIKYLVGKHNFRSFSSIHTNSLKDFNREIYSIDIELKDNFIVFKFIGNGFLKYQVRRMMGLLIEIGKGKYEASYINDILLKKDPRACQYIAPGKGLYLYKVYY